jgi:23S rRNA (uracil1939-C5)-methyltransferase
VQVQVLDRAPRAVFAIFESLGTTGPIQYGGFRVSRNSFFQVNRFLVERLVSSATGAVEGESAWDLYAGAGLFSRALVDRFAKVTAVEAGQSAFRDLEHNLGDRAALEHSSVEDFLAHAESAPDFILADPPRAGLGKDAVRELARLRAPRLAIVSCDPATLARDLAHLLGAGYQMETIELVDLFPRTFHLETVVHLRATAA